MLNVTSLTCCHCCLGCCDACIYSHADGTGGGLDSLDKKKKWAEAWGPGSSIGSENPVVVVLLRKFSEEGEEAL